jgi:ribosomal protein L37AE/L43A
MKKCFLCGENKVIIKSNEGYICGECGYFISYQQYEEYVKKYQVYIEKVKEEREKKKKNVLNYFSLHSGCIYQLENT